MDGGQNLGFGRGGLGFGPAYQSLVPVPDGTVGPIRTSRRRYIEMAFIFPMTVTVTLMQVRVMIRKMMRSFDGDTCGRMDRCFVF